MPEFIEFVTLAGAISDATSRPELLRQPVRLRVVKSRRPQPKVALGHVQHMLNVVETMLDQIGRDVR